VGQPGVDCRHDARVDDPTDVDPERMLAAIP